MNIKDILLKAKDFNLRYDDEIVEECESVHDLYFETTIILYNNYLNELSDLKTEKYLDVVAPYSIVLKDGTKFNLSNLVDFITLKFSEDENEYQWSIPGDEYFY